MKIRLTALAILVAAIVAMFVCVPKAGAQVVDHTSLEATPTDAQLDEARAARVLFVDRSVGLNTSTGLDTLAAQDVRYSRANISFFGWPNVMPAPNLTGCTGWNGMWTGYGKCFTTWAEPRLSSYDIVTHWLDYTTGITTPNVVANYFGPAAKNQFRAVDWQAWRVAHPTVKTFAWTTSLVYCDSPQAPGTLARLDAFNVAMRAWVQSTGEPLVDAADILSHDTQGLNCTDPASGKPRICAEWVADAGACGGHLTPAAQLRMARAVWLMLVALED